MRDAQILRPQGANLPTRTNVAREVIETVALTLLIFLAVHFSVQPFRVDGPSMQNTLHTNELVVVNLLTYDFSTPKRGDVIVFHPPGQADTQYIKRIIGIPGDKITITATAVYVNGTRLDEPYVPPIPQGVTENPVVLPDVTLGKDQYFVMGDNRINSQDSRFFGAITRSSIIGKAELVVWPAGNIGWLPNYTSVFAGIHQ